MAWTPGVDFFFALFAILVQFSVAAALLARPRMERNAILGYLFLLNGIGIAILTFLLGQDRESLLFTAMIRTHAVGEFGTNMLILLLALMYPMRARGLPRAGWVWIPLAAIGSVLLLSLLAGGSLVEARTYDTLTAKAVFTALLPLELAFPLLMLRWSKAWTEDLNGQQRKQLMVLFVAFGFRAFYVMPSTIAHFVQMSLFEGRNATFWGAALALALAAFMLGSMMVAWVRVSRHAGFKWIRLALAAGFLQAIALIALANLDIVNWWSPWLHLDLLLLRPVMVWIAVVHLGFSAQVLRSRWFMRAGLGTLVALNVGFALANVGLSTPVAFTVAFAGSTVGVLLWRPRVQTALSIREYAQGNGQASREQKAALAAETAPSKEWVPGSFVFGRYSLENQDGSVWYGHDVLANRPVVLKQISFEAECDRELKARQSKHPAILPIHLLLWHDPHWILVLPKGEPVQLDGNADLARFAKAMLSALRHVHRKGIIHGDVKPANCMQTPTGFVLADFAASREEGTLRFASHARISGEISPRDDVIALALTILDLQGKHPVTEGNIMEQMKQLDEDDVLRLLPNSVERKFRRYLRKTNVLRPTQTTAPGTNSLDAPGANSSQSRRVGLQADGLD